MGLGNSWLKPLPVEETAARRWGGGCVWETVAPTITCGGNSWSAVAVVRGASLGSSPPRQVVYQLCGVYCTHTHLLGG